jgi:hypothetical protein
VPDYEVRQFCFVAEPHGLDVIHGPISNQFVRAGKKSDMRSKPRKSRSINNAFEKLEGRQMMSASVAPVVTQMNISTGVELNVTIAGGEQVVISQSSTGVTVTQIGTPIAPAGDLNHDGVVNFEDLVVAVQDFGTDGSTADFNNLVTVVQAMGDVTTPGNTSTVYAGTFSEIDVNCVNGNNSVTLDSTVTDTAVLRGGSGNDTLTAGAGQTTLYAGTGNSTLVGGSAFDTFVALGASSNTLKGGTGGDSFWANSLDQILNVSAADTALKAVHLVSATLPGLASPAIGIGGDIYTSFSANPLFSASGPSALDIKQGSLGDCWYVSSLAAIAQTDPNQIRQDIVELNDGTFLVRFINGSTPVYEHLDATLPTNTNGNIVYAQLGTGNSIWVGLMEKAMAAFRYGANTYTDLNGGWMNEAYTDLGIANVNNFSWASPTAMLQQIQTQLNNHEAVTAGVLSVPSGTPLISNHAYTVVAVVTDSLGNLTGLTVRNPWGVVGINGYAGNNGYVTITAAQAFAAITGTTAGTV